jgi:replicative DNA helicase
LSTLTREKTLSNIGNVATSLLAKVTERYDVGGVNLIGVSTGLKTVDTMTGGMGADEMWIIGAGTGVGKSSLAMSMSLEVARANKGVIYYSLEMSAESLVNRLISTATGIDAGRIIRGKISQPELKQIHYAAEEIQDLSLFIVDSSMTSEDVVEHTQIVADSHGDIGLVTVDYAQLMSDPNTFGETERVGRISGNLRSIARPDMLNIPILVLSQLNRASQSREDRTPQLHDLKSASDLEQDAHVVLLLHRPYKDAMEHGAEPKDIETDAKIIVAKSRNGPTGSTRSNFHTRTMTWSQ